MQDELQAAIDDYNSLITRLSEQQDARSTGRSTPRFCGIATSAGPMRCLTWSEYDDAIQAYSAATNRYQHDPESLEAYVQIASCHRRMGRVSEARGTLEQARVVLQRIRPDADFARTTRLARQDWVPAARLAADAVTTQETNRMSITDHEHRATGCPDRRQAASAGNPGAIVAHGSCR